MNLVRLGDLTRIKTGKLDANASSPNGKYPFFTCSREPLRIETYSYDCECVLVAGNGDLNVKYYNGRFDAYQRTYIIESNNTNVLLPRYLFFFLELYIEILRKQSVGGVIKYIKLGNLTEAQIPLCSIQEQTEIIALLEKQCNLIESRKNQLVLFDDLVKSQFIEMFGDFSLRNMKPDWVKVGAIAEVVGGSTPKTDRSEYWGGNNYWVTPAEIKEDDFIITQTQRSLTEKGVSSCSLRCLPVGTVLLSSRAPIGKVAIAGVEMYCNQGFKNLICGKKLNPVYVYVLLKYNSDYLNSLGRGATFKEISKSIVENIYIPVPTIDRQKEFERFVEQTDKSKVLMEKSQKIVQMLIKLIFQLTKIDIEYCNDRKIYSDML